MSNVVCLSKWRQARGLMTPAEFRAMQADIVDAVSDLGPSDPYAICEYLYTHPPTNVLRGIQSLLSDGALCPLPDGLLDLPTLPEDECLE